VVLSNQVEKGNYFRKQVKDSKDRGRSPKLEKGPGNGKREAKIIKGRPSVAGERSETVVTENSGESENVDPRPPQEMRKLEVGGEKSS